MTNTTITKKEGKRYINPKVYDLYYDEVPGYFRKITKEKIIVRAGSEWEGYKDHTITIEDVVKYYATQANNIVSGCRQLGTIIGDWRPIDYLAKECLEIFKHINVEKLRKISKEWGLIPKF